MNCPDLSPGDTLHNRYKISALLGKGAFASVYLAEEPGQQSQFWAVKELREELISPDERESAIKLFKSEAQLLSMLSHKDIPKVNDFFTEGTCHYLVMEFIEGETLEQIARDRAPAVEEVLSWGLRICDILEYLHRMNIIFRDIKPSNVMIARDGRVHLIDYGIARFYSPESICDTHLLGTPGFAPPEQYGKGQSDRRSDIYALGATIFFLLSREDVAKYHFAFPGLSSLNPDVSHALEKVIVRCLEIEPLKRFQRVNDLKEALLRLTPYTPPSQQQIPPPAPVHSKKAPKAPPGPPVKLNLPLYVFAYLTSPVVICMIAFIALFLWSQDIICRFFDGTAITSLKSFQKDFPAAMKVMGIYKYYALALIACFFISGTYIDKYAPKTGVSMKASSYVLMITWIAGIFSFGIFYPNDEAKRSLKCEYNLVKMAQAAEGYKAGHDSRYYPRYLTDLCPKYIDRLPECPEKENRYGYDVNDLRTDYTLWCSGKAHTVHRATRFPAYLTDPDYPQYTSKEGLLEHPGKPVPSR
ncbi:MAG: serine/threonine-protein kinase [Candidatus Eremiobacteraeota bacterium]|nr:serine/threonine-protein kinase [Candidatus Eremiobacteraeota bacterium]